MMRQLQDEVEDALREIKGAMDRSTANKVDHYTVTQTNRETFSPVQVSMLRLHHRRLYINI